MLSKYSDIWMMRMSPCMKETLKNPLFLPGLTVNQTISKKNIIYDSEYRSLFVLMLNSFKKLYAFVTTIIMNVIYKKTFYTDVFYSFNNDKLRLLLSENRNIFKLFWKNLNHCEYIQHSPSLQLKTNYEC